MIKRNFFDLLSSKEIEDVEIALAIGVFDGVHKGHSNIFKRLSNYTKENENVKSMVITFSSNPKIKNLKFIDTIRLRESYCDYFHLNYFTIIDFSQDFSKITGSEFIRLLCTMCRVKAVIVGEDFKCGTPNSHITAFELEKEFKSLGYAVDVEIIANVMDDNQVRISSTILRELIQKGDLNTVLSLSGRPYKIDLLDKEAIEKDNALSIKKESIDQLLPPKGSYKALLILKNNLTYPVRVIIDEEYFTILESKASLSIDSICMITKEL